MLALLYEMSFCIVLCDDSVRFQSLFCPFFRFLFEMILLVIFVSAACVLALLQIVQFWSSGNPQDLDRSEDNCVQNFQGFLRFLCQMVRAYRNMPNIE